MSQTIFKPREIAKFIQGYGMFYAVACNSTFRKVSESEEGSQRTSLTGNIENTQLFISNSGFNEVFLTTAFIQPKQHDYLTVVLCDMDKTLYLDIANNISG